MEKAGETPTEQEEVMKVLGRVWITVYNDCFSIEHTAGLSTGDLIGLFIGSIDRLAGSYEGTGQAVH